MGTVVVAWRGTPGDAAHFDSIQDEILRAALSEPAITVYTDGYPGDATDPLWQLGARWRIDEQPAHVDILLAPLARPPLHGSAVTRRVTAAMREGIPVIATARWPLRALIVDGVTGVLVSPNRRRDWNRAILRLAQDSRVRAGVGTAAAHAAAAMPTGRREGRGG